MKFDLAPRGQKFCLTWSLKQGAINIGSIWQHCFQEAQNKQSLRSYRHDQSRPGMSGNSLTYAMKPMDSQLSIWAVSFTKWAELISFMAMTQDLTAQEFSLQKTVGTIWMQATLHDMGTFSKTLFPTAMMRDELQGHFRSYRLGLSVSLPLLKTGNLILNRTVTAKI